MSLKSLLYRRDTQPLLFGALALLMGALVGFVTIAISNPSLLWLVVLLCAPLGLVVALTTYNFLLRRHHGASAHATVATAQAAAAARPVVKEAAFSWQEWGLLVLGFITFTRFSDVMVHVHGLPSIAKPLVTLLEVGVFARWFFKRQPPRGWARPTILLLAYGVARAASLLYADDFGAAQGALIDYLKDVVIAILFVMIMQRGITLRRVHWALIWAGIFMGTISSVQYLGGMLDRTFYGFGMAEIQHIVGRSLSYRMTGPVGDPNFYAQFLLPLVPLAFERLWNEKKWWLRLLAFWGLAATLGAIVFTFSRGALVALGIMIGLTLLRHPPRPKHLVIAALVLLPVLGALPPSYMDRMRTLVDFLPGADSDPSSEVSFRGRTSELFVGWLMFKDHPLLGVGLHNYPAHYQSYSRGLGLDSRAEPRAPHSLYVEIGAELGLLGVSLFGLLLWSVFRGMHRAREELEAAGWHDYAAMVEALSLGIIGYLAAAIFLHAAYPRVMWVLVGIALGTKQVADYQTRLAAPRGSPVPRPVTAHYAPTAEALRGRV